MIKKKFALFLLCALCFSTLHAAENGENATELTNKVTLRVKHTSFQQLNTKSRSNSNLARKVSFSEDIVIIPSQKLDPLPQVIKSKGEERRKKFAEIRPKTSIQILKENNK